MTLFDPRPPAPRLPAGMLHERGIGSTPSIPAWAGQDELARAIADEIHLGHWCDSIAWASQVEKHRRERGMGPVATLEPFDDELELVETGAFL